MAALTVLPDSVFAASRPASSIPPPPESLHQSIQRLQAFPFRPDCTGNTQEPWRASRHRGCEWVAARAEGGRLLPIVWFTCENALNLTLLKQLSTPSP